MTDHTASGDEVDSGDSDAPAGVRAAPEGVRAAPEDVRTAPADTDGVASTDAYEADGSVVLFDVENPLAWVEGDDAVALVQMV